MFPWFHHPFRRPTQAGEPTPPGTSGVARLRWQVALILLPVLLLAAGGIASVWGDRAAVEKEARRQAADLATLLADQLADSLAGELQQAEFLAREWQGAAFTPAAAAPGGSNLPPVETRLQVRLALPPDAPLNDWLPAQLLLRPDGSLLSPVPWSRSPRPPDWWRPGVGPADSGRLPAAIRTWEALLGRPTAPADEYLALAAVALRDRVETAAGLPLAAVVLAQALELPTPVRPGPEWLPIFQGLVQERPSLLTPGLLDQALGRLPQPDSHALALRLRGLRDRWEYDERSRRLAALLARALPWTPDLATNFWFRGDDLAWLAVIEPSELRTPTRVGDTGSARAVNPSISRVRLFPARLLEKAALRAFDTIRIIDGVERRTPRRLPIGLGWECLLEGTVVTPSREPAGELLAEASSQFQAEGRGPGSDEKREVWPSSPRLAIRVRLQDPPALFAAQRRRQVWLGGLILATAGVAGLGVWQTRRAFQRQLDLNTEQANFVASVSHELRAPVASVRLLAEGLAGDQVEDPARRREYARFIVQESRRLGTLVENVLDSARIEQGRKNYTLEPTDLARLVRETVATFQPVAAERGVQLRCEAPEETLEVLGDGPALQQALVNLLDNATKHAPDGSTVRVALASGPGSGRPVRLTVTDDGPGIPAADQERIFERFHRRGSELRRETQGVGLGLAIARHIANGHHGRVGVESEPGRGATFFLELPAVAGPGVAPQPPTPRRS